MHHLFDGFEHYNRRRWPFVDYCVFGCSFSLELALSYVASRELMVCPHWTPRTIHAPSTRGYYKWTLSWMVPAISSCV